MTSERIQSESSTLGANGQYLLHGVESHGRWLIGEAMTDSLKDVQKNEKKRMCYQFAFHSRGVVLSKGYHAHDFGKQMAQMDVESVMK